MVDPILIASAMELARLGLSAYLNAMKQAGKTEAEIDEMFEKEKAEFLSKDPSKLPDV